MSPDGSINAPSAWHSIRPWNPLLSLSVREITSVSATFILSSSLSESNAEIDSSLASLAIAEADDANHSAEGDRDDQASARRGLSVISDALAKGLSVTVNGSPWQRVFIRIDDKVDEAVIIIYGLMPGRQYDINLALVQAGQTNTIQRQVITEDSDGDNSEMQTDPDSASFDHSTSDLSHSTPSTSPSQTMASTPPSSSPQMTLEDRLNQLQHTLSLVNTERETLAASLKTARRESQKADSALRTEIDILKRSSEKHAAVEHRAKQKILALQEAAKRAQTATRETEEKAKEVESLVPVLNEQKAAKEEEYSKIKLEADRVQKERDREGEKEKKKLESMRSELAGLNNKLDRLNGKKEKLETASIPDLEEQAKEVERELEKAEAESQRYMFDMDDVHSETVVEHPLPPTYMPMPRRQQSNSSGHGPIGRPSPPAPIQRPTHSDMPLPSFGHPSWNPPPRHLPAQAQVQAQAHNPRSSSLHTQQPQTLLSNPQRQSSLKSSSTPTNTSTPNSLSPSPTPAQASTLSSRAPAFEPGRGLKNLSSSSATTSGFSVSPMPIQRPAKTSQHSQWASIYDQR